MDVGRRITFFWLGKLGSLSTLRKKDGGLVALKVNQEKACDRVNWNFLLVTLHDYEFRSSIVDLIMWMFIMLASLSFAMGLIVSFGSPTRT